MSVAAELGVPSGICSDLAENIDLDSRQRMIDSGVTPLQGIDRGIKALRNAQWLASSKARIRSNTDETPPFQILQCPDSPSIGSPSEKVLNEWQSKQLLASFGISTPNAKIFQPDELLRLGASVPDLTFPVTCKLVSKALPHKTEVEGVLLNLSDTNEVINAAQQIQSSVANAYPDVPVDGFLVEEMVSGVVCELLVGVRKDKQFGTGDGDRQRRHSRGANERCPNNHFTEHRRHYILCTETLKVLPIALRLSKQTRSGHGAPR